MKKVLFFCGIVLSFLSPAYGQIVYEGKPLIFFEEPSEETTDALYEQKMRLFGTTDVLNDLLPVKASPAFETALPPQEPVLKTRALFGETDTLIPTNQTAEMRVFILPLATGAVQVQEIQRFLQVQPIDLPLFKRVIRKTTAQETLSQASLTLNGQTLSLKIQETPSHFIVSAPLPLQSGTYITHLSYTLEKTWYQDGHHDILNIGVLDNDWPFGINTLTITVLAPYPKAFTKQISLFGQNRIYIPDAFFVAQDPEGNLFYYAKRPIPAFAPLTLELTAPFGQFTEEAPMTKESLWLPLWIIGVQLAYFLMTLISFHQRIPKVSLHQLKTFHPLFVRLFLYQGFTPSFRQSVLKLASVYKAYQKINQQLDNFQTRSQEIRLLFRGTTRFMAKYIFMLAFLPALGIGLCVLLHLNISRLLLLSLLIGSTLGTYLLYRLGGRFYLRKLLMTIPDQVLSRLNKPIPETILKRFYIKMAIWGPVFDMETVLEEAVRKKMSSF